MCKEHLIKHKTGYLTGLIIALFVVATVLLARAGYLGEGALNLTGDIGRIFPTGGIRGIFVPETLRVAPGTGKVMPSRVTPIGIEYPEPPKVAPTTGKVIIDPTPTRVLPPK